jgi:hypothetical protein
MLNTIGPNSLLMAIMPKYIIKTKEVSSIRPTERGMKILDRMVGIIQVMAINVIIPFTLINITIIRTIIDILIREIVAIR